MVSDPLAPPALPAGRFAGREAFTQCLRDAFAAAQQQAWREIILCDASFHDWPLQERLVVDALQAWSKSGRRLVMVAHQYDAVLRDKARFVTWRKTWGHIIECRVCRNVDAADFPSVFWTPSWTLRRLDLVHSAGVCTEAPDRRVQIRELLDEMVLGSSPGFPASVLGL